MSFLIIDNERYALQIGDTVLGGSDDDVLSVSPLAELPPFAVLSCSPEGVGTITRLSGATDIEIDGLPLGPEPRSLRHGARISVGDLEMSYGELRASGGTAHIGSVSSESLRAYPDLSGATKTVNGRLIHLSGGGGKPTVIPEEGLEIGRDPACGLVLSSKSVSRRHAEIAPFQLGYRVTDRSRNGVFVNGQRVKRSQQLRSGDIVRLGTEELRFEAD